MDVKDSPVWIRLSYVSCASNGLVLMDESLQLLPVVETLDLSRNRFAKVDNLRKCTKLRNLDLGFNHLRSVSSLSEVNFLTSLQHGQASCHSLFFLVAYHVYHVVFLPLLLLSDYMVLLCRFAVGWANLY